MFQDEKKSRNRNKTRSKSRYKRPKVHETAARVEGSASLQVDRVMSRLPKGAGGGIFVYTR